MYKEIGNDIIRRRRDDMAIFSFLQLREDRRLLGTVSCVYPDTIRKGGAIYLEI